MQSSQSQHANTYVLKTYDNNDTTAKDFYKTEVDNFRRLRSGKCDPNLLRYYGSFTQNGSYNLILEYADQGTLEDFFERVPPPSRPETIYKFWHGLVEILSALDAIHNVSHDESVKPRNFQG